MHRQGLALAFLSPGEVLTGGWSCFLLDTQLCEVPASTMRHGSWDKCWCRPMGCLDLPALSFPGQGMFQNVMRIPYLERNWDYRSRFSLSVSFSKIGPPSHRPLPPANESLQPKKPFPREEESKTWKLFSGFPKGQRETSEPCGSPVTVSQSLLIS